jgi:GNAT superfamily N-acetyltransferase
VNDEPTQAPEYEVEIVDEYWIGFRRLKALTYELLYRDFGVPEDGDWYHDAPSVYAVARSFGKLMGAARLLGEPEDCARQLRQVMVVPELRGQGIGRALIDELERIARSEGAERIWLNARDDAYAFYERLGYTYDSEPFTSELTGIVHRRMHKELGGGPDRLRVP